jgi:hypothetical protein
MAAATGLHSLHILLFSQLAHNDNKIWKKDAIIGTLQRQKQPSIASLLLITGNLAGRKQELYSIASTHFAAHVRPRRPCMGIFQNTLYESLQTWL